MQILSKISRLVPTASHCHLFRPNKLVIASPHSSAPGLTHSSLSQARYPDIDDEWITQLLSLCKNSMFPFTILYWQIINLIAATESINHWCRPGVHERPGGVRTMRGCGARLMIGAAEMIWYLQRFSRYSSHTMSLFLWSVRTHVCTFQRKVKIRYMKTKDNDPWTSIILWTRNDALISNF